MSLDIDVRNTRTDESMDMNWLRNPYGLEYWARTNYLYVTKEEQPEEKSLWYVINNWNYDKSEQVDKSLFLEVVKQHGDIILSLERGYFWFTESAFRQFVQPHWDVLSMFAKDIITYQDLQGINMEYFGHPDFHLSDKYRPHAHTLARYQDWYRELIKFAEMLQDPDAVYYCSN